MEIDALQKIVYGISHDFGAPLRSVTQFSQLLKRRVSDKLDEKELAWLGIIAEQGSHAQKMLEQILVYSRLSEIKIKSENIDTGKEIKKILSKSSNFKLAEMTMTEPFPLINMSKEVFSKIMTNIISNALLYHPKTDHHRPRILITADKENDKNTICVEDNGLGVSKEQMSLLTIPFKRMQKSEDYPGMGMGFAFCERLTMLYGGSITFSKSELGGLAVSYCLPQN